MRPRSSAEHEPNRDNSASPAPADAADDATIFKCFTKSLIQELKELEPNGPANHDRVNCLFAEDVIPIQEEEDADILHDNQRALQRDLAN